MQFGFIHIFYIFSMLPARQRPTFATGVPCNAARQCYQAIGTNYLSGHNFRVPQLLSLHSSGRSNKVIYLIYYTFSTLTHIMGNVMSYNNRFLFLHMTMYGQKWGPLKTLKLHNFYRISKFPIKKNPYLSTVVSGDQLCISKGC